MSYPQRVAGGPDAAEKPDLVHGDHGATGLAAAGAEADRVLLAEMRDPLTAVAIKPPHGRDCQVSRSSIGHEDPRAYLSTEDEGTLAALGLHPEGRTLLVSHPGSVEEGLRSTVRDVAEALDLQTALGDIVRSDEMASYGDQLATVRVVFSALAVSSLLVAMVGLLNIGLAALRERTQEFALRRALGATGTDLAVMVLCESQMIAVLASAVAIPVAWAGPLVLSNLGHGVLVRPDIPVMAMVVGVMAGALAALLGSLAPAVRASRVPIAGVLR